MARIPENEIERLKNEVSVQRLVESASIELKKSGKDFVGLCPFHADATASLVVTPAKNLWHCFGCGAAGGPIDWIIKKNGVSFRHAVELLRDGGSSLAAGSGAIKRATVKQLDAPVCPDADEQKLLGQVIDYYHQCLKQSPEALIYLEERGIVGSAAAEAIDTFKLGFANRTLGLRLPDKTRVAGADIRSRLERIGIYRESGHEHFNGSVIVPITDAHGTVTEVYGRKITDRLRKGTPLHLYLPGPHRGVFNAAALAAHQEIILCEALIDALTFWCAGYRNVTSSYGVEGFTDDHLAAFKAHGTRRVLIAYDRDEAGERGAAKVAERLMAEGIECFRIQFPKGMDANEYALKVQPTDKSLGVLIRKAAWLGQGKAPQADMETVALAVPPAVAPPATNISEPPIAPADAPAQPVQSSLAAPVQAAMPEQPAAPALPASPIPAPPPPDIPTEIKDNEITMTLGDRRYRVRGLAKNLSFELLKINLLASRSDSFYVDTLDLYSAKQRASYTTHAALELQIKEAVLKTDLGRVLMRLEQLQEDAITQAMQPTEPLAVQMNDAEREAALALLHAPDLPGRILADLATCGLVGEETNKLVGYLAAVSRKLDKPLGIVIQSSSAAGKTSLMDAVLAFVPEEEKVKYSSMTGQSLFYMGETNLKHKALAIVEEEGASKASYALKLLQSEGELTIASTGKDPNTGNLITQQYRVEGPVALLVTTTARDIDEELLNRCLVLSVDESRHQTRAIHQLQRDRRTLDGLLAKRDREALITLHQNAQRLLRPLDVLNPYARFLTFPDQTTRLRRDHEKYLTLIDTIAFVHQHQRTTHTTRRGEQIIDYIEVTLADIALANRLAHDVLGRSLDELPPQTRRLLQAVDGYVAAHAATHDMARTDIVFSRRALREAINWGDTQLKMHLARLVELEYIVAHRTRTNGFDYELVYDVAGDGDTLRFPGLVNIETLACAYDAARSGQNATRSGSGRVMVGPQSAPGRGAQLESEPADIRDCADLPDSDAKTHLLRANGKITSYPQPLVAVAGS
ncbi:MAG: CHC2 zinc finger domain-containing protein [Telluria sp.]